MTFDEFLEPAREWVKEAAATSAVGIVENFAGVSGQPNVRVVTVRVPEWATNDDPCMTANFAVLAEEYKHVNLDDGDLIASVRNRWIGMMHSLWGLAYENGREKIEADCVGQLRGCGEREPPSRPRRTMMEPSSDFDDRGNGFLREMNANQLVKDKYPPEQFGHGIKSVIAVKISDDTTTVIVDALIWSHKDAALAYEYDGRWWQSLSARFTFKDHDAMHLDEAQMRCFLTERIKGALARMKPFKSGCPTEPT